MSDGDIVELTTPAAEKAPEAPKSETKKKVPVIMPFASGSGAPPDLSTLGKGPKAPEPEKPKKKAEDKKPQKKVDESAKKPTATTTTTAATEKKKEKKPVSDIPTEGGSDDEDDTKIPAGDMPDAPEEGYTWTQTLDDCTVLVKVPEGTRAKQVSVVIKKKHLTVGLKGETPIVDGELTEAVAVDDCLWTVEDTKIVQLTLEKEKGGTWWKSVIVGEQEVDTRKIEPGTSKLSDLDGETRGVVEKMMFDQRAKMAGMPTSDERMQQDKLKAFAAQHPEMDFSKVMDASGNFRTGGMGNFNVPE